ncbi:hypothetical protein L218DRAFT_988245 [Marasmius fiardii PR-910]|nr:hypothetical protein L218DRAFT_988245 [Marasmius fiardii PR-910]
MAMVDTDTKREESLQKSDHNAHQLLLNTTLTEQVTVDNSAEREETVQELESTCDAKEPMDTSRDLPLNGYIRPSINTLPVELLTEIFAYFQYSNEESPDTTILPPAVNFIRVCKHWQMVAVNTPTLWSTIALSNPMRPHVRMVRQWLERSKNCPLTLSLELYEDLDSEPEEWESIIVATEKILRNLTKHLYRWKTVFFSFGDFPIQSHSPLLRLPMSPTAAPILERVDVCESSSFTLEASQKFWRAIAAYPSVRRVVWLDQTGCPNTALPNLLTSPWTNITRLASRFIVDEALVEFLSGCQALEVLHITALEQSDSTRTLLSRPRIRLPSLQELKCRSNQSFALATLLDTLELPMLESLELNEWQCGKTWIDLIERSSCRLKRMVVNVGATAVEEEADIMCLLLSSCMRDLEEFDGSLFCPADDLLMALTAKAASEDTSESELLLPFLKRLRLDLCDFEGRLLEEMLRSRLEDVRCAKLETVMVDLERRRRGSDVDLGFLKSLYAKGLGTGVSY